MSRVSAKKESGHIATAPRPCRVAPSIRKKSGRSRQTGCSNGSRRPRLALRARKHDRGWRSTDPTTLRRSGVRRSGCSSSPFPQPAGHHPAGGERFVRGKRRCRELRRHHLHRHAQHLHGFCPGGPGAECRRGAARSVSVQATVRRDGARPSRLRSANWFPAISSSWSPAIWFPRISRLLESRDLYVNQALLTGEPYPAEKRSATPLPAKKTRRAHPTSYSPAPPSSAEPRPS